MLEFSTLDWIALGGFAGAWIGYAILLEWTPLGRRALNALMHPYREVWMMRMLERDMRMVDTQIMASLQNGTAFFASTSLIAIGGVLTVMRSTDEVLMVISELPLGIQTSRAQWDAKVLGLAVIFAYAFFKFAWAYRLFNYVAILLGAAPPAREKDAAEAKAHARRAARLMESAGRHFNRGQRAFFFALGYLGWFLGPSALIATTLAVLAVTWRRQFASDAQRALTDLR
ncbi:MAG: DUF599 domain-containing protein [Variibacter sp.]|nr:DUF599 domain-containing protein [Variibacter sp.]